MLKNFLKRFELVSLSIILAFSLVFFSGCSSSDDTKYVNVPGATEYELAAIMCDSDEDMMSCKGIPYAAPPVGDLRFAPPEPANLSGIIDATKFGSACPQGILGAEDCLTLNVFTPRNRSEDEAGYPVMVWIHGGAFVSGSSSEPGYNPARLVAEDVIVVTLNYRLGRLGFLAHPALTEESGDSNFGLMDQQLAMRWVRNYISYFGGNPENVTIFGESAGAHSIMSHLVAPGSEDLFDRAIVQSGSYLPTQRTLAAGEAEGVSFAAPVCTGESSAIRACLRSLPLATILNGQPGSYVPATGGTVLPQSIAARLADATFDTDKPILIGSNLNEGTLFMGLYYQAFGGFVNDTYYKAATSLLLPNFLTQPQKDKIADDYVLLAESEIGAEHDNRFRLAYSKIWTDSYFTCNNLNQWNQLSRVTPTYAYWFTDEDAPISVYEAALTPLQSGGLIDFGASHAFEIQYVFGSVQDRGDVTEDQIALSDAMIGFWTEFAKTGAPGGVWEEYDGGGFVMELHPLGPFETDKSEFEAVHQCVYWQNPIVNSPIIP